MTEARTADTSAEAVNQRLRAAAAGLNAFVRQQADLALAADQVAAAVESPRDLSSKELAGAYISDLVEGFRSCTTEDDWQGFLTRRRAESEPRRASVAIGWRVWQRDLVGTLSSPYGIDINGVRREGSEGLRLAPGGSISHTPCLGCPGIPLCDTCGIYFYAQIGDALGLADQLLKHGRKPVLAKVEPTAEVWEDGVNVFDDRYPAYRAASVRVVELWDVPFPLRLLPVTPMLRKKFGVLDVIAL